jgi:LysM repeat protein
MIFRLWNRAATPVSACLAVLLMLLVASCASHSVDSGGLPTHLPDINLSGSSDTPPHNMASYEYPFDSNGRYVSDWAAEGERRQGRAATATSDDSAKWSRSHGGSSGSRKGDSSGKVTSSSKTGSTSKSKSSNRKVADDDSVAASSKSGSGTKPGGNRKVADDDSKPVSSKTGSKSKSDSSSSKVADNDDKPTGTSKPALKRKPSSSEDVASSGETKSSTSAKAKPASSKSGRKYTVKSGDTLSHIAANYGTSVAKIKAANGMSSDFLSIGKVLRIP